MIAYISGEVLRILPEYMIVLNGNVGYKVFCAQDILSKHSPKSKVALYTYQVVKEDKNDLYGFETMDEMLFFELLLSVSGVGPKMALAILGLDSMEKLKLAIANGDTAYQTQIPGIGKKKKKKMVLELQDKLAEFAGSSWTLVDNDMVEALKTLGFDAKEIKEYISQIPDNLQTDAEKIKFVLSLKNK